MQPYIPIKCVAVTYSNRKSHLQVLLRSELLHKYSFIHTHVNMVLHDLYYSCACVGRHIVNISACKNYNSVYNFLQCVLTMYVYAQSIGR